MNKALGVILLLLTTSVCAEQRTPLTTVDAFKQALAQFKPRDAMPGYTDAPLEIGLKPIEGNDALNEQGLSALAQDETANQIYTQYKTRKKAHKNSNSPEMQYAEKLIEGSTKVKEGGCYTQPPKCTTNTTIHTCQDVVHYAKASCEDLLTVSIKKIIHTTKRMAISPKFHPPPIDLEHCRTNEQCTNHNEIHVAPNCLGVSVAVTYNGKRIESSTDQTCQSLLLNINSDFKTLWVWVDITVTEYVSEDNWGTKSCELLQDKVAEGTCIYQSGDACLEANKTKSIGGFPIQRTCWGEARQYQCINGADSSCAGLINQGCAQTLSTCVEQKFGMCTAYSQTFECQESTCVPQPDICIQSLPCVDGACDNSRTEESDDINEGVSRLGAVAGVASDVAIGQIDEKTAKVFAGESRECKSYALGFRDCCTDNGWGEWVKHCPDNMQALQKAKEEQRVVYLGKYKKHKLDIDYHHVFCMFPSKLGAIIQKEGRYAQLHVSFGTAETPDCRGISPLELERIDFDKLDFSPIEQEFISELRVPDMGVSSLINEGHIERLNQEGRAHD